MISKMSLSNIQYNFKVFFIFFSYLSSRVTRRREGKINEKKDPEDIMKL
jgi:hypothetical protein